MDAIEKKHYRIGSGWKDNATITKDTAVGFAKWCAMNYVPTIASGELKYWQKGTYQNKEYYYSTSELYDIYIKSLE